MPKTLAVAEHGKDDGYPFNSLFDKTFLIKHPDNVKDADALLLWGGTDICSKLYGETPNRWNECGPIPSRRDQLEWTLIKNALAKNIPIIGVCRGAQLLCAFDGGTLAQDVGGHQGGHDIVTTDGETMWAAANHHQMMIPDKRKGTNIILATTTKQLHGGMYFGEHDAINNVPEGYLESEVVYFSQLKAIGFQPHPEWMSDETDFVSWCLTTVKEKLL